MLSLGKLSRSRFCDSVCIFVFTLPDMEYTIEHRDGIFIITTSGEVSVQGFIEAYKSIFTHPGWEQKSSLLFDNRKLTNTPGEDHSYGDVSSVAEAFARYKEHMEGIRIASVKSTDPSLAVYFSLWDSTSKYFKFPIERREFQNVKSAMNWLKGSG